MLSCTGTGSKMTDDKQQSTDGTNTKCVGTLTDLQSKKGLGIAEEMQIERMVRRRVQALKNEGLWIKIAPKKCPDIAISHWDHVLKEMEWMSSIFNYERSMKEKITKKCAKMIQNYFKGEELKEIRLAKEEEALKRRVAQQVSKIVRQFWCNVERLVHYKQRALVDIARRRALDEKLTEVLNKSEKYAKEISINLANQGSLPAISEATEVTSDQEFDPGSSESDIEDTIEQEEKNSKFKPKDYENEIQELEDENNLSYEQLIAKYSGYLGMNDHQSGISSNSEQGSPSSSQSSVNDLSVVVESSHQNGKQKRKLCGETLAADTNGYALRTRRKRNKRDIENNNLESECADLVKEEEGDENFQPSGHTLASTKVSTKVPRLLRHELREYQHIGLDWLVTLYKRNLNGILADEMGLGKTIQTIALLAYLAVEEGNWGPHLIVVPSSLLLNWELEFLRWCPSLKILTYYGSQKQRKERRAGWLTPNAFHVCITSYTLAVQDHLCFRRRPWEYLILDEAHNIKNFKSQRWQVLLNFNTQRRLLLTGTPLQNNLMELWSLLHFLMPHVFESHCEFREWFSKPISEITSGSREYNENIVKQFHKTLRPFILRRLKSEVEKQMPKKVEHVLKCKLSKRQRYLYDEFMARSDTTNSIKCGSFLNVLNVLMQLRKVCNHPDLFEPRPVISSFRMDVVSCEFPKCLWNLGTLNSNDINELLNITFSGTKSLELNENASYNMVYEPTIPVRCMLDRKTRKPVLNLSVEHSEMVYVDIPVTWDRSHCSWKIPEIDVAAKVENAVEGDVEEPSQSSSDFDFFQQTTQESTTDTCSEFNSSFDYDDKLVQDDNEDSWLRKYYPYSPSDMQLVEIEKKIEDARRTAVIHMNHLNRRRYQIYVLLDTSLVDFCTFVGKLPNLRTTSLRTQSQWFRKLHTIPCTSKLGFGNGAGYNEIMLIFSIRQQNANLINHPYLLWRMTGALTDLIQTVEGLLFTIHKDFVFCIPAACIKSSLEEKIYRPATATLQYRSIQARDQLRRELSKPFTILHPIASRLATAFPDPRLVEYDCGKLQVLNVLLRDLKKGGHRVLLFTQMSKMLNILEAFFNYHGYVFLRMDGGTKVDQRQLLVERFNKDPKIFCFLLSTRAGGLGINLTGADTVIFYDSDWNPTIDAQAQDRCHRIGQTRDVHIYRLISENSVEENILKTSNLKRLLGEHAIEEGKFNTEFFKKDTFRQLFNLPDSEVTQTQASGCGTNTLSKDALEKALAAAEDDVDDRKAALAAMKEVEAEQNEFTEEASLDKASQDLEKIKKDFNQLYSMTNGIERYALRILDAFFFDWSRDLVENQMKNCELVMDGTNTPISTNASLSDSLASECESMIESSSEDQESDEDESSNSDSDKDWNTSDSDLFIPVIVYKKQRRRSPEVSSD